MLGFAARARKLCFGAQAVEQAVKRGKTKLVVVDSDISDKTHDRMNCMCVNSGVRLIKLDRPGQAAGKPDKMCIAVLDDSFADKIQLADNGGK